MNLSKATLNLSQADIEDAIREAVRKAGWNPGKVSLDCHQADIMGSREFTAVVEVEQAGCDLDPTPNVNAAYGFCPTCGAMGVERERSPNGRTKCSKGHWHPHHAFARLPWAKL